jgi:hypothetical protein
MPSGKNWLNFVYVNLGFIAYTIGLYYVVSIQEIKNNWPLYRCNPMYMPLADNMSENFTYCVQTITTSFMGTLLQPLTFITSSLQSNMSSFTDEINAVRGMFNKIRDFISNIFQSIFGVFLNIIIEFQKIIVGLRDLFGKTIGILTTIMYVIDGSLKTMNSTWNGPPGQMVRALGQCFHPSTKLKLLNGEIKCMKDISLGDILENGSVVYSTMQIDNKYRDNKEKLYKIENTGVNGDDIYVTGSHIIYDRKDYLFKMVKDYCEAIPVPLEDLDLEWFSCLITSDNKIKIGKEIFWDWEDHFFKNFLLKKKRNY